MKHSARLATLLLTAALIGAPAFATPSFAEDPKPMAECCRPAPLSEAKMKVLHETMQNVFDSNKKTFEELRQLNEARYAILIAQTFDQGAFLSVSDQIEKKKSELEKKRAQAFASIADQFTPEERGQLMPRFAQAHQGGMRQKVVRRKGMMGKKGMMPKQGMMDGRGMMRGPEAPKPETPTPTPASTPASDPSEYPTGD